MIRPRSGDVIFGSSLVKSRYDFYGEDTVEVDRVALSGNVQSGSGSSVTLPSTASSTSGYYVGYQFVTTSGTGSGQDSAYVTSYNGNTKVATLSSSLTTALDTTTAFQLINRSGITNTATMAQHARWTHARSVFTYNVNADAFTTPLQHETGGSDLADDIGSASFSINEGDSVLVCVAGIPYGSGHKLADNLASLTAFADTTNLLHISAHQARLGNGSSHLIDITYSTGYESRAHFVYFDRPNMRWRTAFSVQDGSSPYGPPVFAGIQSGTGTGTDAGMGTITISSMYMHEFREKGPVHIIRWPSGTAPPITVIEEAMTWMFDEWVMRDNFVLYPPLEDY